MKSCHIIFLLVSAGYYILCEGFRQLWDLIDNYSGVMISIFFFISLIMQRLFVFHRLNQMLTKLRNTIVSMTGCAKRGKKGSLSVRDSAVELKLR